MPGCAVATCRNRDKSTKGKGIVYHRFPRDKILRAVWKNKCYRQDVFEPGTSRICSEHFDSESYERDLKAELLGEQPKKRLKPEAVPTRNLPFSNEGDLGSNTRDVRAHNRNRSNLVQSMIDESCLAPGRTENSYSPTALEASLKAVEKSLAEDSSSKLKRLEDSLGKKENEIICLRDQVKQLKKCNRQLRSAVAETKRLRTAIRSEVKLEVKKTLGTIFTPGQIQRLLNQKKGNWGADDIINALSIRCLSLKTYLHLKNVIGIPLPGLTTLRRWLKETKRLPGHQNEALELMKAYRRTMKKSLHLDGHSSSVSENEGDDVDSLLLNTEDDDLIIDMELTFCEDNKPIIGKFDKQNLVETLNPDSQSSEVKENGGGDVDSLL